jgi:hypothetical protein
VLGEVVGVHISKRLLNDGVFTFGAGIILRAGGPSTYAEVYSAKPAQFPRDYSSLKAGLVGC